MISLENEFNEVFKSKGGRYNNRHSDWEFHSWILINSRILIEWMRRSNALLPEPYIDVIDNSEPNAYVTKSGDKYFIGITYGSIALFDNIFHRMLSSKNVFPEIGDPARGIDTNKIFSLRLTMMGQLMATKKCSQKLSSIDDIRVLMRFQLIKMAFEFLTWHEFAHIIYGHVDYIHSFLGYFEVKEIEEGKEFRNRLDPLVCQTLEMTADNFAAKQSLAILEMLISNPNALTPELRPYFYEWPSVIKMWVFSTYTFFRLFSNQNHNTGIRNGFHPPPSVRSHLVLATAYSIFHQISNAPSLEKVSKICMATILDVEKAFEEISQKELDFTHLIFSTQEDVFAHGQILLKNWENIKPLLQPFTFLPLTL